jgi:hypothetical protein
VKTSYLIRRSEIGRKWHDDIPESFETNQDNHIASIIRVKRASVTGKCCYSLVPNKNNHTEQQSYIQPYWRG